jgi:HK97 family phage prohead protease
MSDQLETRSLEIRASVNADERTVTGVGVPYGEIITVWGQREMFAPGSVRAEGAKLLFRHADPIGVVTDATDDAAGWHPTARISSTARGDEAYQLARDGVLDGMSVGFTPVKYHMERDDLGEYIVYDEALVREVSLVPFPAYPSARVKHVRSDHPDNPTITGGNMPESTTDQTREADDLRELRESVEDMGRSLAVIKERGVQVAEPVTDTRSAGQILKAIIAGDEDTIRAYNELIERAYTGGTTAAAAIKDSWVGDLTRIYDASSGALVSLFATGTLPQTGMNIEFAELDTNSISVGKQPAEGEPLPLGKVALKTRTAAVETFGGATELTRQEIERSQLPILDRNLEALTMAAAVAHKVTLRAAYNTLLAARVTEGDVVDIASLATATANDWLDAVVDGAVNFEDKAAGIDALLVSTDVFKALNHLETAGHRLFRVDSDARTVGELDLTALQGDIASMRVICDTGAAAGSAAFVNGRALRSYLSPLAQLQDENVLNLTKAFSVYRYGAIAAEIPGFVVPVAFAV